MTNSMCLSNISFSYTQILIYDSVIVLPGLLWSDAHYAQGFARREDVVSVRTLEEDGVASVSVYFSEYELRAHDVRVVEVPFHVKSGSVTIEGVEEVDSGRRIDVLAGHYAMTVAQRPPARLLEGIT